MATAIRGLDPQQQLDGVPSKVGRLSSGNYFWTWFDCGDTEKVYVRIAETIGGLTAAGDQEVCDLSGASPEDFYGHAAHIDAAGALWVIAAVKDEELGYVRVGTGTISGTTFTSTEDFWLVNEKYVDACRWPDIVFEDAGEPVCSTAYGTYTTAKTSGFTGATSGNISVDFTENVAGASEQAGSVMTKDDDAEDANFYYLNSSDDLITRRSNTSFTTWFAAKTLSDVTSTALPRQFSASSLSGEAYVCYKVLSTGDLDMQQRGDNDAWDAASTLAADHAGNGTVMCRDDNTGDLYCFYVSTDTNKIKCQKYTSGVGWDDLALSGDAVDATNEKYVPNCQRAVAGTAGTSIFLVWAEDNVGWVGQDVVSWAHPGALLLFQRQLDRNGFGIGQM